MSKNLIVIGDLIIDKTHYVRVTKISPEAPVPTAELLDMDPEVAPGGAGFAAAFATAQKTTTVLCSTFTADNITLLNKYNVKVLPACMVNGNVTKERIIDKESGYHILRLDNDLLIEKVNVTPRRVLSLIKEMVESDGVMGCVLADYKKGFFNTNCRWHQVIDYLTHHNIPTILDTRMENIRHFMDDKECLNKDLWLKLNQKEAEKVKFNLFGEGKEWEENAVPRLLITEGSKGLTMFSEDGCVIIPVPEEYSKGGAPDTTGCGDIFDVSFIRGMIEFQNARAAAEYAVEIASKYAWIPFKEKLCLVQKKELKV